MTRIDPDPVDDWFADYVTALRGITAALRLAGLDPASARFVHLPAMMLNELVQQLAAEFGAPDGG